MCAFSSFMKRADEREEDNDYDDNYDDDDDEQITGFNSLFNLLSVRFPSQRIFRKGKRLQHSLIHYKKQTTNEWLHRHSLTFYILS